MKRDVVESFRKRWIPLILDFTQGNLGKMDKGKMSGYQRDLLFLSTTMAERYDEAGFRQALQNGSYEGVTFNLNQTQNELKKLLKYWERKKDSRTHLRILYHVKTLSSLWIERDLLKNDRFTLRQHLLYEKGQAESLRRIQDIAFFFMKLLDGIPLSAIRTCKGCKKYFLHLSKRKKDYCSSACASRSIQRTKRESLREDHPRKYRAYLKKQKERMKTFRASIRGER